MDAFMDKAIKFLTEDKLSKVSWMISDVHHFMKTRIQKTMFVFLITTIFSLLSVFLLVTYVHLPIPYWICIFPVLFVSYIAFKWDYWRLRSKFKVVRDDVYKAFPLWISTLEILVMTNNIPNTFKKSIATCPQAFRQDLIDFVDKIQYDPENKAYYREFLSNYDIPEVNEIIMDMYAFNRLDKKEIIYEFKHLNERLNKISAKIRQERQNLSIFGISAMNSIPLFTVSIYVLLISMLINVA